MSSDYFDAVLKPQHLYQVSNVSFFLLVFRNNIVAAKFQFFHIGSYESRILLFTNFHLNLLGNSLNQNL